MSDLATPLKRWRPPLESGEFLLLPPLMEHNINDSICRPGLNLKGDTVFSGIFLFENACLWNSATQLWESMDHMEKPKVNVPTYKPTEVAGQ